MRIETVGVRICHGACDGNDYGRPAQEATATTATESGAPAPPLDTPAPSVGETVPGEIVTAARKLLADELDVDEGDFRLDSSKGVEWFDTSSDGSNMVICRDGQ